MTSSNMSKEEINNYLDILQEDTTRKLTPAIVFLTLIAVIGLFGNTIVLLVYSGKVRRSATDIFIMAIAASDLVTNVWGIPAEIYGTFHYWDYKRIVLCKIKVYSNEITTLSSAMILLAVAVTRYKKICRPFGKQTTVRTAKRVSVSLAVIISVAAWPQLFLYGAKTKPTPLPGVFGTECSTSDAYLHTIWPMVYVTFLMLLFLGACTPLVVLNVLIGIQAWRHSKIHGIPMVTSTPTPTVLTGHAVSTESDILESEDDSLRKPPGNETVVDSSHGPRASKSNPQHRVLTRTTLMLILISAVYVIAFLSHLLVITFRIIISNFIENMSDAGYAVYNIFLRFYFLNSAANSLIYSLCDARFRDEFWKIFNGWLHSYYRPEGLPQLFVLPHRIAPGASTAIRSPPTSPISTQNSGEEIRSSK